MQAYRRQATSEQRLEYGTELGFGLRCFSDTEALGKVIDEQNTALEQAWLEREKVQREGIASRAQLRFADWSWDQLVRMVSRIAQIADGGAPGPISRALFPEGVTAEVAPTGPNQLKSATAFIERFRASKHPGVEKLREEWLPKLAAARDRYEAALEARGAVSARLSQARLAEQAARDDHLLAVDKLMGQVRAAFPKDKARWAVIFPPAPSRAKARGEASGEDSNPEETPSK